MVLAPAVTARVLGRLRAPPEQTPTEREFEVLTLVAPG
jgi:hypothetical protein